MNSSPPIEQTSDAIARPLVAGLPAGFWVHLPHLGPFLQVPAGLMVPKKPRDRPAPPAPPPRRPDGLELERCA
jgi:hypothetical protein